MTTEPTPPPFPHCPACHHGDHGLPCATPVVTRDLGGMRTDPCGCRGVWGDAA